MPCYSPDVIHLETNKLTGERKTVKFFSHLSKDFPGYEFFDHANEITDYSDLPISREFIKIPCRKCAGCIESYSRDWAIRCMCEAEMYPDNWFITFTYDDVYLPRRPVVFKRTGEVFDPDQVYSDQGTLDPDDMTKFLKRLRKKFSGTKIRYFYCGEYGSTTKRPHYHGLFFNLPLKVEDLEILKITSNGDVLYTSKVIEDLWSDPETHNSYGFITIAPVNYQTCCYTARYVQKKLVRSTDYDDYYTENGQHPEFLRMSRMPGLGTEYFKLHGSDIYANDEMIFKGSKERVYPIKPPHFFDGLYGIENEEDLARIKARRSALAKLNNDLKNSQTTLSEAERLKIEERTKLKVFSALKRDGFE